MKTYILPGYSEKNRQWAEEIKDELSPEIDIEIHEWEHWREGSFSLPREKKRILDMLGGGKVNIIAKSVGTRVLMQLLPDISGQVGKVILCGIPTRFGSDASRELYKKGLSLLSPSQVIIFQNEKDPLANYEIIKKFVHSMNANIEVRKMPRSDHHYPYSQEFRKILS